MNLLNIFLAIVAVESGGYQYAMGDKGNAVGPAQIWPAVVQDCNRIAGKNFTLSDRYCFNKSQQMFEIYTNYYGRKYGTITPEIRARIWNGGPAGPKKQATNKYWSKVRARIK